MDDGFDIPAIASLPPLSPPAPTAPLHSTPYAGALLEPIVSQTTPPQNNDVILQTTPPQNAQQSHQSSTPTGASATLPSSPAQEAVAVSLAPESEAQAIGTTPLTPSSKRPLTRQTSKTASGRTLTQSRPDAPTPVPQNSPAPQGCKTNTVAWVAKKLEEFKTEVETARSEVVAEVKEIRDGLAQLSADVGAMPTAAAAREAVRERFTQVVNSHNDLTHSVHEIRRQVVAQGQALDNITTKIDSLESSIKEVRELLGDGQSYHDGLVPAEKRPRLENGIHSTLTSANVAPSTPTNSLNAIQAATHAPPLPTVHAAAMHLSATPAPTVAPLSQTMQALQHVQQPAHAAAGHTAMMGLGLTQTVHAQPVVQHAPTQVPLHLTYPPAPPPAIPRAPPPVPSRYAPQMSQASGSNYRGGFGGYRGNRPRFPNQRLQTPQTPQMPASIRLGPMTDWSRNADELWMQVTGLIENLRAFNPNSISINDIRTTRTHDTNYVKITFRNLEEAVAFSAMWDSNPPAGLEGVVPMLTEN